MDKETAEQLRTTKALYDDGVLTEEEYNAKKQELLHAPAVVVAQPPAIVAQPPANEYGGVVQGHVVTEQPQKVHPEPRPQEDILAKRCECERRCECGIRPERPTKKDGKPDYGFRWDGEVQKWVSNHRSNEAGGPPADGRTPRRREIPTVGDLLIYFVCCPCAVGYFLWVSAPACWAALYAHVLAPVGGFVHDHLLGAESYEASYGINFLAPSFRFVRFAI